MVARLAKFQPHLPITPKDQLCVQLAGLLHDVGHGPYSHLYDGLFPKQLKKELDQNPELSKEYVGLPKPSPDWKHEDGSCLMIDALQQELGLEIDEENLDAPLKQIGDGVANSAMRVYENEFDDGNLLTRVSS